MKKLAITVIFGVMVFLAGVATYLVFPQIINWPSLVQTLTTRIDPARVMAGAMLLFYVFMALMVTVSFGKWMLDFAKDVVDMVLGYGKKKEPEAQQTLDNTLIINSPKLKKPTMRFLETMFSLAVWLFFVYLFQAIITTFMWVFGMGRIYMFNFSAEVINGTLNSLLLILYTAAAFIVVLFVWAQWNFWRFGRLERRKPRPAVRDDEVANFFALPLATVNRIQNTKIAFITPLPNNSIVFHEHKPPEQKPIEQEMVPNSLMTPATT